jgi:hypothetical protein
MKTRTLYEVYDNRAVLTGSIDGLVLLDRRGQFRLAKRSARKWAGCVVKVTAEVYQESPMMRRVLALEIAYVYRRRHRLDSTGGITFKQLRGVLTTYDGKLNRYKKRRG